MFELWKNERGVSGMAYSKRETKPACGFNTAAGGGFRGSADSVTELLLSSGHGTK